ncbi:hypothetical protein KL935_000200 [Ogataea polymorpha]|nr:hypothetical protein KL935_000200 [Ogataea polymorpha]KAG7908832.1 hypothetical protein KL906_003063 [Ogataea polymorpha]KAG7939410.1 hypothetical protein KL934_000344 [Ogataea polymorpha]
MELEIKCTEQQYTAITSDFSPDTLLGIKAGPGSGKTRTIASRIAHLLSTQSQSGMRPDNLLVLSLTNRSVNDLRTRLRAVLGPMAVQIPVMTFHSFAGKVVGCKYTDWNILDDDDLRRLARLVDMGRSASSVAELRSHLRDARRSSNNVAVVARIMEMFGSTQVFTHDDVLEECSSLLNLPPKFVENYKVVFVDEFQDVYPAIMNLVLQISKGRHLTLAGDSDQSIYGFLGASFKQNWERLMERHPKAKIVHLNQSFRSTPEVLQFANAVLGHSTPIHHSVKPPCGLSPLRLSFASPAEEREFIYDEVTRLVDISEGAIKPSDIAILSYTNREVDSVLKYFSERGRFGLCKLNSNPRWLQSPLSFLMQYVRVLVDPRVNFPLLCSLSTVPHIGEATLRKAVSLATEHEVPVFEYLHDSEYEKPRKLDMLPHYVNYIAKCRSKLDQNDPDQILITLLRMGKELGFDKVLSADGFTKDQLLEYRLHFDTIYNTLQRAKVQKPPEHTVLSYFMENYNNDTLVTSNSIKTSNDNEVNFSTIHTAKGLEFPIVFILSGNNYRLNDTQRRVLYVGMTRASSLLYFNKLTNQFVDGLDHTSKPLFSTRAPNWTSESVSRLITDLGRRPLTKVHQLASKLAHATL